MKRNDRRRSLAIEFLTLLPNFIRPALMSDDRFRASFNLDIEGSIFFGGSSLTFKRDAFFGAVERLYGDAGHAPQPLSAEDGTAWTVEVANDVSSDAVRVSGPGDPILVEGYFGLKPDAHTRVQGFEDALKEAGLTSADLPDWREVLNAGVLTGSEIKALASELATGPAAILDEAQAAFEKSSFELSTIIPAQRAYYEWLIGRPVETLTELVDEVIPSRVARLLAWSDLEGARQALALSSHATIFNQVDWSSLSSDRFVELANWAQNSDDLISKIGIIELGLPRVASIPEMEAPLLAIAKQLCTADDLGDDGALRLLTAMFMLVEGEFSRTKVLRDYAPFQRRLAALTHASLLIRIASTQVDFARFSQWAIEARARLSYLQTHVDLRLEPRWLPDYAGPQQLKSELIGRLHNATERSGATLPDGPLRDFLLGGQGDGDTLSKYLLFPFSFAPGPLEGGTPTVENPLPDEIRKLLETSTDNLSGLDPRTVTALINLQGVYTIDPALIDQAVDHIKAAGHRFTAATDERTVQSLVGGLASLACVTRNPALADAVKVLCRKRRHDRLDAGTLRGELLIAMVASGARADPTEWLQSISTWVEEIAFAMPDKTEARYMLADLEALCGIDPRMRLAIGRTMAALDLFARS